MENVPALRLLVPADTDLLARATLGNVNWSEQRFTEHDVSSRSHFRRYTQMVPERGDFGIVAEYASRPIGVAWAQFRSASDPGFGFVDESTAEVSLWVRDDSRGRGIGRALLRRLQHVGLGRGLGRLSLSVEAHNYARNLYRSEGFLPVAGRESDGVMLWTGYCRRACSNARMSVRASCGPRCLWSATKNVGVPRAPLAPALSTERCT